jgi:hypothetical protein
MNLDETETDSDSDSDSDDIIENIEMEEELRETDLMNHATYIGMPIYENFGILLGSRITPRTYFKYENKHVCKYLDYATCSENVSTRPYPDIMKLEITKIRYSGNLECEVYSVIIKTHWIKIVQRRWKKVMAEKHRISMGRGSLANLRFFEMNGKHLPKYAMLPRLRGCLRDL